MSSTHSFDDLVTRLQAGDEAAKTEIFERFAGQLLCLARRQLDARIQHLVEPDEVLQSAFRSFFVRQGEGRFTLDNWNSLWGLIARITVRKCHRKNAYYLAARRSVTREVHAPHADDDSPDAWEAMAREPTPAEAVAAAELVEELLREETDRGRDVLMYRLQEYTEAEIARQVGCSERTVRRVLERARKRLEHLVAG